MCRARVKLALSTLRQDRPDHCRHTVSDRISPWRPMVMSTGSSFVFRNPPTLMTLSSQDGHVVTKIETCGDADDVFVNRKRRHVYVSCGEGVVDVLESGEGATGGLRAYRQYRERARRCSCPSSTGCSWQCGRRPMSRRRCGYSGRPHEGGPSFGGVRYRGVSYLLV